ncbi:chromosome partitioning protein ParA (plasmid) [Salinigranum rubrum]|uniref:Chromosome partitioning protein ParA n=1 Tax=Salinigranum rubrum TaxID=755307 RepID=A0A2I8VQI5_9EURY|nr:ParA family protein [Salinigranum rubrum]AUV84156.1 chromosome partitioning protein ParA [Salinigranum rubrum]
MLSYAVYSEAGGVGKTTMTANLAVAHARAGLDVLAVPLDPQDGDLSYLFDVDQDRANSEVDTLVHHLVNRNSGELTDLIKTVEHGVDIIPEHNRLEDLAEALRKERDARSDFGESFPMYTQLQRVLREAEIHKQYDVLIVDPPASSGPHLYNALDATRNIVLPFEPSGKGQASVSGLNDLVTNLESQLEINIGVLAVVPNRVKGTRDQKAIIGEIEEQGFDTPVVFGDRTSLLEGCWREKCSAYRYIQEHRNQRRDYELETLAQFDRLARHLESEGNIEAPNPPNPGELDRDETEVKA